MKPVQVHRYEIPLNEAVEALIGDAVGDCEGWQVRVEAGTVVVDVVEPWASGQMIEAGEFRAKPPAVDDSQTSAEPEPVEKPKGGPLARRAAILCGEKGFQVFTGTDSKEAARAAVCRACGVESRAELDHDQNAGAAWSKIEGNFRLWADGYDAEFAG